MSHLHENLWRRLLYARHFKEHPDDPWMKRWQDGRTPSLPPKHVIPFSFQSDTPPKCCSINDGTLRLAQGRDTGRMHHSKIEDDEGDTAPEKLLAFLMWAKPGCTAESSAETHTHLSTLISNEHGHREGDTTDGGHVEGTLEESRRWFQSQNPSCIIFVHGNASNILEEKTDDVCRVVLSNSEKATSNLSLLMNFDYRGYGSSTGLPCEEGLIADGIAAVKMVMERLQLSLDRITLFAHSLGTAIAAATYKHFMLHEPQLPRLRGLLLANSFTNAHNLLRTYAQHRVPYANHALTFWDMCPPLVSTFQHRLPDKWDTKARLSQIVRETGGWRISVVHACNDINIRFQFTIELFEAMQQACPEKPRVTAMPLLKKDSKRGQRLSESYTEWLDLQDQDKQARLILTPWGEHRYGPCEVAVQKELMRLAFDSVDERVENAVELQASTHRELEKLWNTDRGYAFDPSMVFPGDVSTSALVTSGDDWLAEACESSKLSLLTERSRSTQSSETDDRVSVDSQRTPSSSADGTGPTSQNISLPPISPDTMADLMGDVDFGSAVDANSTPTSESVSTSQIDR